MRQSARWFRGVPAWLAVVVVAAAVAACAAQAPGPATAPGAGGTSTFIGGERMSFLELLERGGWFMVPIGLCSLLAMAVIIERLIALRRGAVIPSKFLPGLKGVLRQGAADRAAGLDYCRSRDCPISRVAQAGLRKMRRSVEAVDKAIEDAGGNEISKLRRNLRMLYGSSAVAPMLGLLGTVWGMIEAFQVASDPNVDVTNRGPLLGKGIYEALVTTFAGLTVAIPALIFYYYFLGKIDKLVHEMNEVSMDLVEHCMGDEKEG